MTRPYAIIEKRIGETPLEALERFRATDAVLAGVPLSYAGRLDPMAEGKLLVLIGEECKRKDVYLALDKEYAFEVLFGVGSDSGDVLGMPEADAEPLAPSDVQLAREAARLVGEHELPYPLLSSKPLRGTPLFMHALSGAARPEDAPLRIMRVLEATYLGSRALTHDALLAEVAGKISLLSPPIPDRPETTFRREEVIAAWRALSAQSEYSVARFRALVSSGTYIRSLAPLIARRLGARGLALSALDKPKLSVSGACKTDNAVTADIRPSRASAS